MSLVDERQGLLRSDSSSSIVKENRNEIYKKNSFMMKPTHTYANMQ